MSVTLAELEEQARKLPPEDRARLVEAMLETLQDGPSPELEDAWDREIAARIGAYERGESKTHAAEDVFAEARRLTP
jgi:putative addiction module component (TIGR02574 family)